MTEYESGAYLQLLLLLPMLIVGGFFLWTQQRALLSVRPENRRMQPVLVWLQLIPPFGMGWQFYVIGKVSDSLRDDLNTPNGDSLFSDDPIPLHSRPTYSLGISYALLFCLTLLPLGMIKSLLALAGLIVWITYWIELARFTKRVKQRYI